MRLTRNPLAAIRVRAGYDTAQAAADRLDCSRLHVLNIERGRVGGSPALLAKMSRAYGVPIATLAKAIRSAQLALLIRKLAQITD